MNKNLSIITTVFLPLGRLPGLQGINVGGIPANDNPFAFLFVCLLLGIVVTLLLIFREIHWVYLRGVSFVVKQGRNAAA